MIRKEKLDELKQIINEFKTVEVKLIKEENEKKFLQSNVYNFKLNNGIIIKREKLLKGGNDGSAAIIIPVLTNGEIFTVIEPRVFTDIGVGVGFPAGYIEQNEDPKVAALRELEEETGYVPTNIIEIDSFYQDEGCSSALNHIFLALGCNKIYDQKLDKDEFIKYITFNYEELFELEKMGYISGCNAKLALEKSKSHIKR